MSGLGGLRVPPVVYSWSPGLPHDSLPQRGQPPPKRTAPCKALFSGLQATMPASHLLPGSYCDPCRAPSTHPLAKSLDSAVTAHSPASLCPVTLPTAPRKPHPGIPHSLKEEAPPPLLLPTPPSWMCAPSSARHWSGPSPAPGLTEPQRPGQRWEPGEKLNAVDERSVPKVTSPWNVRMGPRLETGSLWMLLAKPKLTSSRLGPDAMAYNKTPRRGHMMREAETEVKHL